MEKSNNISTDRKAFLSDLADPRFKVIVVDFDNTLLLGNSTELFIELSRPRWAAWLLAMAGRLAARVCLGRTPRLEHRRDFFRVMFVACGLPWSLFLWRRTVGRVLAGRLNARMVDGLKARSGTTIVVASHGFRQVIEPLLAELPAGSVLIASDLRPPFAILRETGKVAALEARGIPLADALSVSDSLDDDEVLRRTARGYRLEWEIPEPPPKAYFPLRFTACGKYRPHIFLWQHVTQDLPVIVLAYYQGLASVPLLLLLYVTFFTVYETGYYENDFVAAAREKSPTLHPGSAGFRDYPIHLWAWIWTAVLTAAIGWLASFHAAFLWLAFLAGVRLLFYFYNRLSGQARIPFYLVLQVCKYFGCWVVIVPAFTGVILLAAQALRMIGPYVKYRLTGKPPVMPYQLLRFVAFFGLLAVAAILSWSETRVRVLNLQSLVIALWVCGKVLADREGFFRRYLALRFKKGGEKAVVC